MACLANKAAGFVQAKRSTIDFESRYKLNSRSVGIRRTTLSNRQIEPFSRRFFLQIRCGWPCADMPRLAEVVTLPEHIGTVARAHQRLGRRCRFARMVT